MVHETRTQSGPEPHATLLGLVNFPLRLDRDQLLLLFTSANLAFLALDVAIAHSENAFTPVYEWVPVIGSPLGALTAFWLALHRRPSAGAVLLHVLCMLLGVAVGTLGLAFHLRAMLSPLGSIDWAWAVFSAPVIAPLSFAGVSLIGLVAVFQESPPGSGRLSLLNLLNLSAPMSKTQHLLWLVGLGFVGAMAMSFLDHGQYGYRLYEWIPIVAGGFAGSVVIQQALRPDAQRGDQVTYFWTMVGCIMVGMLGFAFHLSCDVADSGALSLERMRAFAPIFAPLLFGDLAILGLLIGISDAQAAPAGAES